MSYPEFCKINLLEHFLPLETLVVGGKPTLKLMWKTTGNCHWIDGKHIIAPYLQSLNVITRPLHFATSVVTLPLLLICPWIAAISIVYHWPPNTGYISGVSPTCLNALLISRGKSSTSNQDTRFLREDWWIHLWVYPGCQILGYGVYMPLFHSLCQKWDALYSWCQKWNIVLRWCQKWDILQLVSEVGYSPQLVSEVGSGILYCWCQKWDTLYSWCQK